MKKKFLLLTAQPKIVSGTLALIQSATTYLLAIIAVLIVVAVLWNILKYLQADANDRPQIVKNIKMTIIIGVIALVVDGTIAWVSNFYK